MTYEARFGKAAQAENTASLPTIAYSLEYMTFQKEATELLLMTNRKMTERDKMFERIDLIMEFTGSRSVGCRGIKSGDFKKTQE